MRILAFLIEPAVLDRILTHLRTRDTLRSPPAPARDPPSRTRRSRTVGTVQRA